MTFNVQCWKFIWMFSHLYEKTQIFAILSAHINFRLHHGNVLTDFLPCVQWHVSGIIIEMRFHILNSTEKLMSMSQIEFKNRINVSSISIIPNNYLFKPCATNVKAENAEKRQFGVYPFVRERNLCQRMGQKIMIAKALLYGLALVNSWHRINII